MRHGRIENGARDRQGCEDGLVAAMAEERTANADWACGSVLADMGAEDLGGDPAAAEARMHAARRRVEHARARLARARNATRHHPLRPVRHTRPTCRARAPRRAVRLSAVAAAGSGDGPPPPGPGPRARIGLGDECSHGGEAS